jgi:HEPN domain-containing protein
MTPGELLHREAAKGLEQAAKDLTAAKALVNVEASRSAFHSQQAAEKAIKGFLPFRQIAFRKTHDLTDLGSQCAEADPTLEPFLREVEELTDYASAFRHPDAPYEPDGAEALEALAIATKLRDEVLRRISGIEERG